MKYLLTYIVLIISLLLTNLSMATEVFAPERIVWQKRPVNLGIEVGQEKIIHFPDDIRYWVSDYLKNKTTIIAANGVLYITALAPFDTNRIRVQGINDNQIYLLDVVTTTVKSDSDEVIILNTEKVSNQSKDTSTMTISKEDWRIRLSRYAAQRLYAPERVLSADAQIKRIAVDDSQAVALIRGERFVTRPLAAWAGGGYVVVAVELRNQLAMPFTLGFDAKQNAINLSDLIRGAWLTATLQHTHIGKRGSDTDTTTLYLVSRQTAFELGQLPKPLKQKPETAGKHDGE